MSRKARWAMVLEKEGRESDWMPVDRALDGTVVDEVQCLLNAIRRL